ncbi:MAG TPA: hypothetical protein VMF03_13480 [Steroidobacteraceae bacterium]|nr:hypothetical protein [Steroidobacteraceae bacterium]
MGRVQRILSGLLLAAACGSLAACGHSAGVTLPFVTHHALSADAAGSKAPNQASSDLVSAVALGGSADSSISLKFQVGQRPVAGQPVPLLVHLVANQPLEHLEARFHGDEGLDIPKGGSFDPADHLQAGTALDHTLTVIPAHEGVFTLMATITTGTAAEALSRSFVIPIVVGPAPAAATGPVAKSRQ